MQCVQCQRFFAEDRDYFVHLTSQEHEDNRDKELDLEEEALLAKYG